jgi:hypothetical protein
MVTWLRAHSRVAVVSMLGYIGEDPAHPVKVHEVTGPESPYLDDVMAIYTRAFNDEQTAVSEAEFRQSIALRRYPLPFSYHLWAIEEPRSATVAGMASFFTFATAGFGGYIALVAPLRGTGALGTILARIERQLVNDNGAVRGWFIECENDRTAGIFTAHGFRELVVTYRQPELREAPAVGQAEKPLLKLLYKELGARYQAPVLSGQELLSAIRDVFRHVYRVPRPDDHPSFRILVGEVGALGNVPFMAANGG